MKTASIAEVTSHFGAFLKATAGGPVVVTRYGKPVAMLIGIHDEDEVERLLMAVSPRLNTILEESRRQIRDGEVLSHDEFWAEVAASRATKPNGGNGKTPRGRKRR